MKQSVLFVIIIAWTPDRLSRSESPFFVVWNVGQGLWTTLVESPSCEHVDSGGETFPSGIDGYCRQEKNALSFTHWDWDHVGFAGKIRNWPHICVQNEPGGSTDSQRKKSLLQKIERCQGSPFQHIKELFARHPLKVRTANADSRVYIVDGQVMVTGDLPAQLEKTISFSDRRNESVRMLVLGHHGSRTSTSGYLLDRLIHLHLTIASSRRGKYGHPHREVLDRLRHKGIPIISTEEWGNIAVEL